MDRRTFIALATAASAAGELPPGLPKYRIVSHFQPSPAPGMPGKYPGSVVRVRAEQSIDTSNGKVNVDVVREMIAQGMRGLTGVTDDREAWRSFFAPNDVVGIKVNCSGAPHIRSTPEVVAEIVRNLVAVGVPARQIW